MSNLLPAAAAWETVRRLADAIRAAASREQALLRDHAAQEEKLRRRREILAQRHRDSLRDRQLELDARLEQAQQSALARAASRRERLLRARKNAAQQRQWQVEDYEGRRKYELQKGTLAATRQRDADLAAAEQGFRDFSERHSAAEAQRQQLEAAAAATLQGYRFLAHRLQHPREAARVDADANEEALLAQLQSHLAAASDAIRAVRRAALPVFFANFPYWVWLVLIAVVYAVLRYADLARFGVTPPTPPQLANGAAGAALLVLALYALGAKLASAGANRLAAALAAARVLSETSAAKSAATFESANQRTLETFDRASRELNAHWSDNINDSAALRGRMLDGVETRHSRALAKLNALSDRRLVTATERRDEDAMRARAEAEQALAAATAELDREQEALKARHAAEWNALAAESNAATGPLHASLTGHIAESARTFPAWSLEYAQRWEPPAEFTGMAPVATLDADFAVMAGGLPADARLALPGGGARLSIPLLLDVPGAASLLVETSGAGRVGAVAALNNAVLRLLAGAPAGRLSFTIIDPVELGQNFAGLMHLADHEERLINNRIWTQPGQIDEQLARLNEHIEKVSQMYLRNEYATIAGYNAQAGRIAEKYHFLVVADFPVNCCDTAARRLMSIAVSGARCGVHTLIHWDHRRTGPAEFVPDELRQNSVRVRHDAGALVLGEKLPPGATLRLETPPDDATATALLHRIGRASVDSNRVEVPFADVTPPESARWSLETTEELRVPVGRTGATKLQYLGLGKGTRQHALIAGKTGSGKSTLFHVIITNLALWCRPDQVEFYLVDFKKGVEFKCYATHRLPHARVVAIESDREFGLSVLERLDAELKRRGDLFRKTGAQDLAGYRRLGGAERMPRCLLLIDEFQEFFTQDDRVSQNAALLLDRIVRQGRAFGIHVVLGSQTLGGAYTLARATLGQMVVRVALQCNEADAFLIMDENNPAPRLLSRPGEAIYNDAAGGIEGNSPFQIVWVSDAERDAALETVRALAAANPEQDAAPVVFEGNAPSDIRDNVPFAKQLAAPGPVRGTPPRAWLGAPNSIKGPTEAVFPRQGGANLLVAGQREETALALAGLSLVSLAAQHARDGARFVVIEATAPESPQRAFLESVTAALPQRVDVVKPAQLDAVMAELAAELERRGAAHGESAPAIFVIVHELQKFKRLRFEEDFGYGGDAEKAVNPGRVFDQLIAEGPALGIHVLCTCDTYNNLSRTLSRKAVSEFEMRVLFQMSANDSASLIDSPKAAELGLHRAVLSNGQQGFMETFRPYAPPDAAWIAEAAAKLAPLRA